MGVAKEALVGVMMAVPGSLTAAVAWQGWKLVWRNRASRTDPGSGHFIVAGIVLLIAGLGMTAMFAFAIYELIAHPTPAAERRD
jgi:hypothetical protein